LHHVNRLGFLGWTLPTGNDITVNSAFRKLGGSNKVVIDVGFPVSSSLNFIALNLFKTFIFILVT